VGSGQWAVIVLLLVSSWLGACVEEEYDLQGEGNGVEPGREYGDGEARVAWSFNGIDDNAVGYELYGGDSTDVVCETEAGATGARLTCVEEGIVPNRRVTRRVRSVVSGLPVDPAGTFITSDPATALAPIEPPPVIIAVPEIAQRVRITNWCRPIDAHSPFEEGTRMELQRRGPVPAGSETVPDDAAVTIIPTDDPVRGYPPASSLCDDLVDPEPVAVDQAFSYRAVYFDRDGNPAPGPWSAPLSSCTGGEEVCDGRDNNCSGVVDDRAASCYTGPAATRGVGACRDGIERCSNSAPTPCLGEVRPLTEICDGLDNDCDGTVDEGFASAEYFVDGDWDGYGSASAGSACAALTDDQLRELSWRRLGDDCDDRNDAVNPGAAEVCNGLDDNCVNGPDEGFPRLIFYADRDGDGYGNSNDSIQDCRARPTVYTTTEPDDCNDSNPAINPGALEICDDIDNNCNRQTDEDLDEVPQYRDRDGDGYGGGDDLSKCLGTPGFVVEGDDCNDANRNIYPGAPEPCGSSADRNCDVRVNANPQFTVVGVLQAPAVARDAGQLQARCDNPLPATGCWTNTLIVEIQGRHTNSDANPITNVSILGDTTTLGTVVLSRPIPGDNTVQTRKVCVPTTSHTTYSSITAQVEAPAGCSAPPAVRPASQRTYGPQERCDGHDSNCAGDRDDVDPAVTECDFNSSGAPGYCANIRGTYRCEFQSPPVLQKICHSEDSSCISITNTWLGRVMRLQGTGLTFPGETTTVEVLDLGAGPGSSADDGVIRLLTGIVQTSPTQLDNIVLPSSLTSEYGHLGIRVTVGSRTSNMLPLLDIGPVAGSFVSVPAPARAWTGLSCSDGGDNQWTVDLVRAVGAPSGALRGIFAYDGSATGEARPGPVSSAQLYTQFSGYGCNVGCSGSTANACGGGYRCMAGRCIANECTSSSQCGGGRCILGNCQYIDPDQLITCPGGEGDNITVGMGGVSLSPNCQAAVVLSEVPGDPGNFNLQAVHLRRGGTYWSVLSGFEFADFETAFATRQYREDLHSVWFSADDRFALISYPSSIFGTPQASLELVSLSTGARALVDVRSCATPGSCRLQSASFQANGSLAAVFGGVSVTLSASEVPHER
jgi:hypothetical protein